MRNKLKAICITHIGFRNKNEDNYLFNGSYTNSQTTQNVKIIETDLSSKKFQFNFFAVADGMGGHNAGEVASRVCVEALALIEKKSQTLSSISEVVRLVQSSIVSINEKICALGRNNKDLNGMGTTLVLFITFGDKYAVLNIGDSRAYYFDGHSLTQITKDHTEGQRMLDLGLLSRKELANFPAKKNLSRYIGYDKEGFILQADVYYPEITEGVVLLCSDGITDSMSDERISGILSSHENIEVAGKILIEEAVAKPDADNATAILISIRR